MNINPHAESRLLRELSAYAYRDIKNGMDAAKREGMEKGIAIGTEKGIAIGTEKGIAIVNVLFPAHTHFNRLV